MFGPPDPQDASIDAAHSTTTRVLILRFMVCPPSWLLGENPRPAMWRTVAPVFV